MLAIKFLVLATAASVASGSLWCNACVDLVEHLTGDACKDGAKVIVDGVCGGDPICIVALDAALDLICHKIDGSKITPEIAHKICGEVHLCSASAQTYMGAHYLAAAKRAAVRGSLLNAAEKQAPPAVREN